MARRAQRSGAMAVGRTAALAIAGVVVALVVAFIVLSPLTAPSPPSKPAEKVLILIQQEWGFNQTKGGPTITVDIRDKVILQVSNIGQVPHDVAVVNDGGAVVWNSKSKELQLPGSTAKIEFLARDAGRYSLICTIPGHRQLGMEAQFIVQRS